MVNVTGFIYMDNKNIQRSCFLFFVSFGRDISQPLTIVDKLETFSFGPVYPITCPLHNFLLLLKSFCYWWLLVIGLHNWLDHGLIHYCNSYTLTCMFS